MRYPSGGIRACPKNTATKRRANIFIASSKEALPVAGEVKSHFDGEAHMDIWSEIISKANRNYLDTLLTVRVSMISSLLSSRAMTKQSSERTSQSYSRQCHLSLAFFSAGSDQTARF